MQAGEPQPRRAPPDGPSELVLVDSKIRPPSSAIQAIDRPQLLARLSAHSGPVLVTAPPGYGKSTLLSQWLARAEQAPAWVTLEPSDNDPVVMWSYVVAALRAAEPGLDVALPPLAATREQDIVRVIVPQLLNQLQALGTEIVLVLDDYQCITSPACHASVQLLLAHQPSNVRLVISTRTEPPLALSWHRAAGDLLELGMTDLRFSDAEASRVLTDALGLRLSAAALTTLQDRAEGWPAGLYLAYLSLRDAPDTDEAVSGFQGSNRRVGDYLTEIVLDALDPPVRDFLLETSVLERMCGPLCDAVTQRRGSAQMLIELERANQFLTPLDDRRDWYRYHHLFRELLQAELVRRAPERVAELHARAFGWLVERAVQMPGGPDRRHVGEAIGHAVTAGDVEAAGRLIGEHYLSTIEWGGYATVVEWLALLPRSVVAGDARLSIVEAWAMSFLSRRDEASAALQNALDVGCDGPLPDGATSLEASAALLRAGFPWGDAGEMLQAARRAFELEGGRDSMWRVTAHVQLGWALSLHGRFDDARPLLARGAALASLAGQPLNELGARCLLAWLALDADQIGAAEQQAREAVEVLKATGLGDTAAAGYAWATLGAVRARRHDLAEADRLLKAGVELMRGGIEPLLVIEALLMWVPVRRALGFPGDARRLVAEAEALIEECADPGILRDRFDDVRRLAATPLDDGGAQLTPREIEILRLLATTLSQREIGRELYVSYNTVHTHLRAIYRKLGVASRLEAVETARDHGLLNDLAPGSPV